MEPDLRFRGAWGKNAVHMNLKYRFAIYADLKSLARVSPLDQEIRRSFGRLPVEIEYLERDDLKKESVFNEIHALFIPGIEGEHSYYPEHISPHKADIQAFIRRGGVYYGECAGAFLAGVTQSYDAPWLDKPKGDGQVLLELANVHSTGPIHDVAVADDDDAHFNGLRLIPLSSDFFEDKRDVHVVYSKGPMFIGHGFNTLAFYDRSRQKPAVIETFYGRGMVMLSGPMPKFTARPVTGLAGHERLDALLSAMGTHEADRQRFFDALMLRVKRHIDKNAPKARF